MQETIAQDSFISSLVFLTLLAPLLSMILSVFIIPSKYGWLSPPISSLLLLVSTITSFALVVQLYPETFTDSVQWFQMNNKAISAGYLVDNVSLPMILIVNIISFLVHVYSIAYMADDTKLKRYFGILGVFTFSMLALTLSNNLLLTFFFWELVGFSSYMLIGHWTNKSLAGRAAQKAFIINRFADLGFIISLLIIWANVGTFDISDLQNSPAENWKNLASITLLLSILGKSAQLPFFNWLPDAMEGPTPVSALIHAATMVAAGVYLLIRINWFFTPTALDYAAIIGGITALFGALSALSQFDIKRILAYSTISQLGFMVMAVGCGAIEGANLHLITHAFFKAGLFLVAGSIIHALHQHQKNIDVQDIRNLGGLYKQLPVTALVCIVSGASLVGIPFFSGFISKDAILSNIWLWSQQEPWRFSIVVLAFATSLLTTLYTFRFVWFVFFSQQKQTHLQVTEPPWAMRFPLIVLAICSLWFVISINPFSVPNWINIQGHHLGITFFSIAWITLALIASWLLFRSNTLKTWGKIFENGFYLDILYTKVFSNLIKQFSFFTEYMDKKWIDRIIHGLIYFKVALAHLVAWFDKTIVDGAVNTTASTASAVGSITRSFQGGKIQLYIFWTLIGLIIFLFFLLI